LSNWDVVRTGAAVKPVFEEVGPYNFTRVRSACFDRQLVPDNEAHRRVRFRKHHGSVGGRVQAVERRRLASTSTASSMCINPAYISVMANLQRSIAQTAITGVEAEVSLHAAIVAGALTAVMEGILDDAPDGFLASTFLGAIPTVLQDRRRHARR
jgi:hypothetical protein